MNKKPLFEYRIPHFSNFQSDLDDAVDSIFQAAPIENGSVPLENPKWIKQERISMEPDETDNLPHFDDLIASVAIKKETSSGRPMRRSISFNHISDIQSLQTELDNMNFKSSVKQKSIDNIARKFGSREHLGARKEHCNDITTGERYISTAEHIYHLEKDTPKRFRTTMTRPDQKVVEAAKNRKRAQLICRSTIPQSPALLCKTRRRPVIALSQEQLEEQEWEEIQKFHIKANPIPKNVLDGPSHLPPVQRRPPTKPEPFNITTVKKPTKIPQPEKFKFIAKPVPTAILGGTVGIGKKPPTHLTFPVTPTFMKSRSFDNTKRQCGQLEDNEKIQSCRNDRSNVSECGSNISTSTLRKLLHPVKPKPFSFEERDKAMLEKKDAKIKEIIEEEKRRREFRANPIPSVIKKIGAQSSPKRLQKNKENICTNQYVKFEAKPPVVLQKEPFKPIKKGLLLTAACPFNLATEKRLVERRQFDLKVREQELLNEERRKEEEHQRTQEEQKEIAKLRSQLVHQANPIRHYQAVKTMNEIAITIPESPHFQFKKKQHISES